MKRLGLLVSGRGSNMLAVIEACKSGILTAEVAVVICHNRHAPALEKAREHKVKAIYLDPNNTPERLDMLIQQYLTASQVDYVLLAGYMKKIGALTLLSFKNRILNIHPSLLPKYGGKGMFGIRVHKAVIAAGETETGVTIHIVNEYYDDGKILSQRKVSVQPGDTPQMLAKKVLNAEHQLYAATMQKIIDGKIALPDE